jgi:hypothetical protein
MKLFRGIGMKLFSATNETIPGNIYETIPSLDDSNPDTFVICKAMVSLFQNYELGLLTGFGIWGC